MALLTNTVSQPSEIGMTEGDKNEVKFEIEKFEAKKRTKYVVQVD